MVSAIENLKYCRGCDQYLLRVNFMINHELPTIHSPFLCRLSFVPQPNLLLICGRN